MRVAILIAFHLAYASQLCSAPYSPSVGEKHFDFTLPNIETREPVSLSQFRGRPVLLVHFASW